MNKMPLIKKTNESKESIKDRHNNYTDKKDFKKAYVGEANPLPPLKKPVDKKPGLPKRKEIHKERGVGCPKKEGKVKSKEVHNEQSSWKMPAIQNQLEPRYHAIADWQRYLIRPYLTTWEGLEKKVEEYTSYIKPDLRTCYDSCPRSPCWPELDENGCETFEKMMKEKDPNVRVSKYYIADDFAAGGRKIVPQYKVHYNLDYTEKKTAKDHSGISVNISTAKADLMAREFDLPQCTQYGFQKEERESLLLQRTSDTQHKLLEPKLWENTDNKSASSLGIKQIIDVQEEEEETVPVCEKDEKFERKSSIKDEEKGRHNYPPVSTSHSHEQPVASHTNNEEKRDEKVPTSSGVQNNASGRRIYHPPPSVWTDEGLCITVNVPPLFVSNRYVTIPSDTGEKENLAKLTEAAIEYLRRNPPDQLPNIDLMKEFENISSMRIYANNYKNPTIAKLASENSIESRKLSNRIPPPGNEKKPWLNLGPCWEEEPFRSLEAPSAKMEELCWYYKSVQKLFDSYMKEYKDKQMERRRGFYQLLAEGPSYLERRESTGTESIVEADDKPCTCPPATSCNMTQHSSPNDSYDKVQETDEHNKSADTSVPHYRGKDASDKPKTFRSSKFSRRPPDVSDDDMDLLPRTRFRAKLQAKYESLMHEFDECDKDITRQINENSIAIKELNKHEAEIKRRLKELFFSKEHTFVKQENNVPTPGSPLRSDKNGVKLTDRSTLEDKYSHLPSPDTHNGAKGRLINEFCKLPTVPEEYTSEDDAKRSCYEKILYDLENVLVYGSGKYVKRPPTATVLREREGIRPGMCKNKAEAADALLKSVAPSHNDYQSSDMSKSGVKENATPKNESQHEHKSSRLGRNGHEVDDNPKSVHKVSYLLPHISNNKMKRRDKCCKSSLQPDKAKYESPSRRKDVADNLPLLQRFQNSQIKLTASYDLKPVLTPLKSTTSPHLLPNLSSSGVKQNATNSTRSCKQEAHASSSGKFKVKVGSKPEKTCVLPLPHTSNSSVKRNDKGENIDSSSRDNKYTKLSALGKIN